MSLYLGTSPIANTGYDKANTSLSNLTSTGKNIANWSNNVTNCLTEIPQDIKLELNNGILTLKAGSKVYVPNGAGVFDTVTITSDYSSSSGGASGNKFYFWSKTNSSWSGYLIANCISGSTQPSAGTYQIWYNTTENKIYQDTNKTGDWTAAAQLSLPIAIFTSTNGAITSIDQVFNGFGYIGSTVFALPGVKGLIPNGRNNDGTLNNIEFETSNVLTQTYSDTPTGYYYIQVKSDYVGRAARSGWGYNEKENYVRWIGSTSPMSQIICGSMYMTSGKFTNIEIPTAFHALDYNDSSTISGWAMPSSRYINLTLGASGATYTAPANGYFCIHALGDTSSNHWIEMINDSASLFARGVYGTVGWQFKIATEAKKGDIVNIMYMGINTPAVFRFIYAKGEN